MMDRARFEQIFALWRARGLQEEGKRAVSGSAKRKLQWILAQYELEPDLPGTVLQAPRPAKP